MSATAPAITVNGQLIPEEAILFELTRLVQFYSRHMPEEQVRSQLPLLRRRAVDQAIGAKLLIDEARRLKIEVGEAEIDARIAELEKQAGGVKKFQALLKKQGVAREKLREQIGSGRRVDKLVAQVTAGTPEPSEADVRAHFESHRAEYSRPERVLAQHILVKPADEGEAAREAARAKLAAIRDELSGGGDFSKAAAAHSDCPSGPEGGSLGWFARGMMVKEFDEVVFALQVGELSGIIETPFGYHLIVKTAHEEPGDAEYGDVREGVRDFLLHARRGEALAAHVAKLRAAARIEGLPA